MDEQQMRLIRQIETGTNDQDRAEQERTATAKAEAALAPLEAKARALREQQRAEHRASVLREAIDVAREEGHRLEESAGIEPARGARSVAYLLRKLLAKAQPATAPPTVDRAAVLRAVEDAVRGDIFTHTYEAATAQPAPADQLALRDRVAAAMARADGWEWAAANFSTLSTPAVDRYRRCAEAVLQVLPTSDRAAVLRAVEDAVYEYRELTCQWGETDGSTQEIARRVTQAVLDALNEQP